MARERNVAGLTCSQVLEHLSAYVDGELEPELVARIERHLAGCHWCERFGHDFNRLLQNFRNHEKTAPKLDPKVTERLLERLASEA
ncbi:MAG: zf-HC2 domain-containing protein [Myxococcota bacterium]